MPIVPTFNSNIPTVRDAGATNSVPLQLPQQNYDYGKLMKEALTPLKDLTNSAVKFVQAKEARAVKAESDDAEREIIRTINGYMNDPEKGYLFQQGKNAISGYQPAMEGMQKDVEKILGNLSPKAREAVQSRAVDRMTNAQTRAQQWAGQQQRKYEITSSQSRVEALIDDAAVNYNDTEYVDRTYSSICDEVDYQANLLGMDEDTKKKFKNGTYDLVQAGRFQQWSQVDPLTAFAAFQDEKGNIGPDVQAKIDSSLWQSAKVLLAAQLAEGKPLIGDKADLWHAVQTAHTGIPLVDGLSPARKAELFSAVQSRQLQKQTELRSELKDAVQNTLSEAQETGASPNMLDEGAFIDAYGEKDGQAMYSDYRRDVATAAAVHNFASMPVEAQNAVIRAATPQVGDKDYADKIRNRDALIKAQEAVQKSRKSDPVAYAITHKEAGYEQIDFSDLGKASAQIAHRAAMAGDLAKMYGTEPVLFSDHEVAAISTTFKKLDGDQAYSFVESLDLNEDAVKVLTNQVGRMKKGDDFEVPFKLYADPNLRSMLPDYFEGQRAISEGRVKLSDQAATNEKDFNKVSAPIYAGINGLYTDPTMRSKVEMTIRNIAAGKIVRSGLTPPEAIDQAVKAVAGVRTEYRGAPISLYEGADISDVEFAVKNTARELRKSGTSLYYPDQKKQLTPEAAAKYLDGMSPAQLKNSTERNKFYVVCGMDVLRDQKGNPFVVTVTPRPFFASLFRNQTVYEPKEPEKGGAD